MSTTHTTLDASLSAAAAFGLRPGRPRVNLPHGSDFRNRPPA